MSSTSRAAWVVAASVGAVEALKDQGICRWNSTIRSLHQYANTNLGSYFEATKKLSLLSSSASSTPNHQPRELKARELEEHTRKLMYLCNWGPNSVH